MICSRSKWTNCKCSKCRKRNHCLRLRRPQSPPNPPANCEFCNNADFLDGLDSTQFLRSDTSSTLNGDLTINGNLVVNNSFIQFPRQGSAPFVCEPTRAGAVFFNTSIGKLQVCNGTNFETINSS